MVKSGDGNPMPICKENVDENRPFEVRKHSIPNSTIHMKIRNP